MITDNIFSEDISLKGSSFDPTKLVGNSWDDYYHHREPFRLFFIQDAIKIFYLQRVRFKYGMFTCNEN